MVYKYLAVDDKGKFVIQDDRFPSPDWAFKTMDGLVIPCYIYDAIVLSDQIVSIRSKNYYIDTLKAVHMDDVESLDDSASKDAMFIKDASNKLPDPYTESMAPFTAAVILACSKNEKNVALTKEQHQAKLTILRSITTNIKNGVVAEISVKKAEELLSYYGLDLTAIIKEELIINKA